MPTFPIRIFGDPGLKASCKEVPESEFGSLRRLADDMTTTMYEAPGVGLAANQIGVLKRLFVYDVGDGPYAVVNPTIVETDGEYEHDEGCLSVPDLFFPMTRANRVHLKGWDLSGAEVDVEGEKLLGRVFLHEVDHLDGHLLLDRLDRERRKAALKIMRHRTLGLPIEDVPEGVLLRGAGERAAERGA